MRKDLYPVIAMGLMMLGAQLIAIAAMPIFKAAGVQAFEDPEDVTNALCYIGMIIGFTAVVLVIVKLGKQKIIHIMIMFTVLITLFYVFYPLINRAMTGPEVDLGWGSTDMPDDVLFLASMEPSSMAPSATDSHLLLAGTQSGGILSVQGNAMDAFENMAMNSGSNGPIRTLDSGIYDGTGSAGISPSNTTTAILILTDTLHAYWEDGTEVATSFSGWVNLTHAFLGADGALYATTIDAIFKESNGIYTTLYHATSAITSGRTNLILAGDLDGDAEIELAFLDGNDLVVLHPNTGDSSIVGTDIDANAFLVANMDGTEPDELLIAGNGGELRILAYHEDAGADAWDQIWAGSMELAPDGWINGDLTYTDGSEILTVADGYVSIIYKFQNTAQWRVWNISKQLPRLDPDTVSLAIGDFDGDGMPDIVFADGSTLSFQSVNVTPPPSEMEQIIEAVTDLAFMISLALALGLSILLYKFPEWYIVDGVGLLVAAGAIIIIGISLAILPLVVLLLGLAVYDAISVYKTKHMIDLADAVMDMKMPILLVVPKTKGYSFRKEGSSSLKEQIDQGKEREAMFMGLGDIVIPSLLMMSSLRFLPMDAVFMGVGGNLLVALGTMVGIYVGFAILMIYVMKGNPQAGLPLLNSGALGGYFITYLLVFGDLSFGIRL